MFELLKASAIWAAREHMEPDQTFRFFFRLQRQAAEEQLASRRTEAYTRVKAAGGRPAVASRRMK